MGGFLKLRHVHTPTDMRGALGTLAHAVNWLLPPDPEIEKRARHAVEAITADLFYIGPQDYEMFPSYLDSIEEPLSELKSTGLGLAYAVLAEATKISGQMMENWSSTIYVVSEHPLVFVSIKEDSQSALHLLNGCEETERSLIRCQADGVAVFPKQGFNLSWFDQEKSWCPECWKVVSDQRIQLRLPFGAKEPPSNDIESEHKRELLTLQAMIAPVMGMSEKDFADHLDELGMDEESKRMIMATYRDVAAFIPGRDKGLDASLQLIRAGETQNVELKSSFAVPMEFDRKEWEAKGLKADVINQKHSDAAKATVHSCLKTIAAFINVDGGTLFIGVRDDKTVIGLEQDFSLISESPNVDGLELKVRAIIKARFDPKPLGSSIEFTSLQHEGQFFLRVDVKPDFEPHHLDGDIYLREGNETVLLKGPTLTRWIAKRHQQKTLLDGLGATT